MKAKIKTTPIFRGIVAVRTKHVSAKNTNRPKRLVNNINARNAKNEVKRFWLNKKALENVDARVVQAGKKNQFKGIVL